MTLSSPAPRSEYERLLRFIVSPGQPFGLLAACVNDSRREAELREAAIADAEKAGVRVVDLDLRALPESADVVRQLAQAIRDAGAPVLFVRGADELAPRSGRWHRAQALNFARDRLSELLPARIVLWMSVEGRTRLAQAAPDLSNVILSTLVFPTEVQERVGPMLHQLGDGPGWQAQRIDADDPRVRAERELLLRVLEDGESSTDARIDAGLRIAEIDAACGALTAAEKRAVEIVALARSQDRPTKTIDGLSLLASIAHSTGRTSRALQVQLRAHREIEKLLSASSDPTLLKRRLAWSFVELGDLYAALGQGEQARASFQHSLEIAERLASAEPDRVDYQRDLSVSYERMGDLYRALGQGDQAQSSYQQSLEIAERLASAEPTRADYQRDLSVAHHKMGDLYVALGQGDQARASFQNSLEIAERLASAEPTRADYQRDLSVSYQRMGDLYRALGQGDQARASYQQSLDIVERLASAEPARADYQRDRSVLYERMGELYAALGQGEQARASFQQSLEIRERLASAEPARADYQRDLSVSYNKMGDLYAALGQGEQARASFQQSLEIRERLASAEPARADYQRDLAASCQRMAQLSEGEEATRFATECVAALRRVLSLSPEQADVARDLGLALLTHFQLTKHQPSLLEAAVLLVSLRRRDALEAQFHELADQLEPVADQVMAAQKAEEE